MFVVAKDPIEAKARALALVQNWQVPHRDYLFEAEKVINVSEIIKNDNIHLNLVKTDKVKKFEFICKYILIGK